MDCKAVISSAKLLFEELEEKTGRPKILLEGLIEVSEGISHRSILFVTTYK